MKKSFYYLIALAGLCLLLCPRQAQAQYVYGVSAVGYDSQSRQIFGYSETYLDYYTAYYYDPAVRGDLYWEFGIEAPLDEGYNQGYSDPYYGILIPAVVYTDSSLYKSNTTYEEFGQHFVRPYYYYSYCYGFSSGCFSDPYGFSYFSGFSGLGSFGFPGFFYDPYYRVGGRTYFVGSTQVFITTPNESTCGNSSTFYDSSINASVPCPPPPPPPPPPTNVNVSWSSPSNPPAVPLSGPLPTPPGSLPYVNSMVLTATGSPAGGTFSWTTSSNKVTLSNITSTGSTSSVTVTSVSKSASIMDVQIDLSYTYNNVTARPTPPIRLTVQEAQSMGLISVDSNARTTDCAFASTNRNLSGWKKVISWQVQDQFGQPINFRLPLYDTLTNDANNCNQARRGKGTAPGRGTNTAGQWLHDYRMCSPVCAKGKDCAVKGVQRYYVNGYEIDKNYTMKCSGISVAGDGSSPPASTSAGPTTVGDFVDNMWVGSLQDLPSESDLQAWTNALINAHAQGQQQMLAQARAFERSLFQSAEYASLNRSDEDFITDLYWAYLMRNPEDAGYYGWLSILQNYNAQGVNGREYLLQGFEGSAEFQNLVNSLDASLPPPPPPSSCDPVQEQSCYDNGGIWNLSTCFCNAPPDPCLKKPWLCDPMY